MTAQHSTRSSRRIRALGQHMLISAQVADRIVTSAQIGSKDTVLEIGTGNGILTQRLAKISKRTISYEVDRSIFERTRQSLGSLGNAEIVLGDAFDSDIDAFDVCVTSLPYSESLRFARWLASRAGSFKRCVAVVQSEFAAKLSSERGLDSYRAASVLVQFSFEIEKLFKISRNDFDPPPKVLSEVIKLTPRIKQPFFDKSRMRLLDRLFSFRSKITSAALKKIVAGQDKRLQIPENILASRVENLTPNNFVYLIEEIEGLSSA